MTTTAPRTTSVIEVTGARQHNLRDVSVEVPVGALTVVTGVSGSGKSSLVFATIAAESERQLHELLPAFARNRLSTPGRPEVDAVRGLPPAVVVDQRPLGGNARSTVGTRTEVHTMLRLLFSRIGTPWVGYSPAFSFNDPAGMCPRCEGLGRTSDVDVDRLIDRDRSLAEGAIRFPTFQPGTFRWKRYVDSGLFDEHLPLRDYDPATYEVLLTGSGFKPPAPREGWPPSSTFEGVLPRFRRTYVTRSRDEVPSHLRALVDELVVERTCPDCGGTRLNEQARSSLVAGHTIADLSRMELDQLLEVVRDLDAPTVAPVLEAIEHRLSAMVDLGLGYLSLDRVTTTLSGGESQRLKLVRHLGSSLTRLLFVLDEPSAGLHPHDVGQLIGLLRTLRDEGNTVLVVEHDLDVVAAADHVIDVGPGSGTAGGRITYAGDVAGLALTDTATGHALGQRPTLRTEVRTPTGWSDEVRVNDHNLRDVAVRLPRGVLTVVTGVAGAGKSTLVRAALPDREGVVHVARAGSGGSRRSTVATLTGVLDPIRQRFATAHGVDPSLFSANAGGACPDCGGTGVHRTDLAFLDEVVTTCEACGGTRFRPESLTYRVAGRDISQVLAMTVAEARAELDLPATAASTLAQLEEVGVGYLTLDQPVTTLSGGERQRVQLAIHLDAPAATYVLDEPTTGLHARDVTGLLATFDRLVDAGSTVVVVEHHLDVIAHADWVLDVGPGAGRDGGRLVFAGPPADLLDHPTSPTAAHLRRALDTGGRGDQPVG